jgi:hypothetical protein
MTGDVCDCGICEVETCDLCAAPVAFVDEDGDAWCRACWLAHIEGEQQRANDRWMAGGSQ